MSEEHAVTAAALAQYLQECAAAAQSGVATDERSYYPAVNRLLSSVGDQLVPRISTVSEPAAVDRQLPDVALFEKEAAVIVAPVEVKPASTDLSELISRDQPTNYARTFGGGYVLVTNIREFAWAGIDAATGNLVELERVTLTDSDFTAGVPRLRADAAEGLDRIIATASTVRQTLAKPEHVARLLAHHAKQMANKIRSVEDPTALLQSVSSDLQDILGIDVEDAFFVPTVAQTLVYGLFSVWLDTDKPTEFEWIGAQYDLRVRVIRSLFTAVVEPDFIASCDLKPHLEATARVLRRVDRDRFEADFNQRSIEYFYEPFLAIFDPDLRDKLGVWYTPSEVAEYQIRRIHNHLQNDLGIQDGLADESVWVLDPAVGTGTYLRAVLDAIYDQHISNGVDSATAAASTLEAALTRVVGFEILPAALVVAHLHIARFLERKGAPVPDQKRLSIYLSNSLRGWGAGGVPPVPRLPGLQEELQESSRIKGTEPVLVMCGNPPYEGFSAADSDEERELLSDWVDPLREVWGLRKHRLGDLYVRFWRIAVAKIAEQTGRGVVSFITNRKWLGGRSFPAMRQNIVEKFDLVVVDDLHGDFHEDFAGDESIFLTDTADGIKRGVAITTLVRTGDGDGTATVRTRSHRGSGAAKRDGLAELGATKDLDEGLLDHPVSAALKWKFVASTGGDDPSLDEYFDWYLSGVQTVREEAVTDHDKDSLTQRMRDYFDKAWSDADVFGKYPGFNVERERYNPPVVRQRLLASNQFQQGRVVRFLYKAFDERYLYWEPRHRLLNEARRDLIPVYLETDQNGHLSSVEGQFGIVATATSRRRGAVRPALTSAVPSFEAVDPNARVFPRLRAPQVPDDGAQLTFDVGVQEEGLQHNIRSGWVRAARDVGVTGTSHELGDIVYYALIAIMYSPSWAAQFGTDNDDFATVPLPADAAVLVEAARVGKRIAALSDVGVDVDGVTTGRLQESLRQIATPTDAPPTEVTSGNRHSGGSHAAGTGLVLTSGDSGWKGVSDEIWAFSVGGFQVLPKWLGYRHTDRGYEWQARDVREFTHLGRRIAAILELQPECDRLYQSAVRQTLESIEPPALVDGV